MGIGISAGGGSRQAKTAKDIIAKNPVELRISGGADQLSLGDATGAVRPDLHLDAHDGIACCGCWNSRHRKRFSLLPGVPAILASGLATGTSDASAETASAAFCAEPKFVRTVANDTRGHGSLRGRAGSGSGGVVSVAVSSTNFSSCCGGVSCGG